MQVITSLSLYLLWFEVSLKPEELICIVEGHGDEIAVPLLVRRIAFVLDPSAMIRCRPWRNSKGALLKPEGLERNIVIAARRYPEARGILVVIDADRDCPALVGPELLKRAVRARSDLRIGVVLAKCEYEAWFIAAIQSLGVHPDLRLNPKPVDSPEEIVGAKEWLATHMRSGKYVETRHQPAFTNIMDLNAAQRTRSFCKLVSEIGRVLLR